jgi:type II secretory pathway pseudopilin PulG
MCRNHKARALTFVEVLIVCGIIAILSGIAFGATAAWREDARQCKCMSNLRQIYAAMQLYWTENPGPSLGCDVQPVPHPGSNLIKYIPREVFLCPDTPPRLLDRYFSTYSWGVMIQDPASRDWQVLVERLAETGPATPIVECEIHDEVYYMPRERSVDSRFLGRFEIELHADGSIRRGRTPGPRIKWFTRPRPSTHNTL